MIFGESAFVDREVEVGFVLDETGCRDEEEEEEEEGAVYPLSEQPDLATKAAGQVMGWKSTLESGERRVS